MGALLGLGDIWGIAFYASAVLLPLVVGRWWVVAALAGPLIAGVALELTGHMPDGEGNGGLEYDFGFVFFVIFLSLAANVMLLLVGVRKLFDFISQRWLTPRA
jgi:hypothetical protein